ncbi:hypothetical protein ACPC54_30320 [Kitasatospora sp. NPDC094028]
MNDEEQAEPTPAQLRELRARTEALAREIAAVQARLAALDEPARSTSYPLGRAQERLREAAAELGEGADELARARTARDPRLCKAHWGACPDCGNTLASSGGRAWCRSCPRTWDYDRLGTACIDVATHEVSTPNSPGETILLCQAHARDAAERLDGAVVTPIDPQASPR